MEISEKLKDFPVTHMFAGPCPRCKGDTVSYNAELGLGKCEAIRVTPMNPISFYGPIGMLYPRDIRTPCGWRGRVKFQKED